MGLDSADFSYSVCSSIARMLPGRCALIVLSALILLGQPPGYAAGDDDEHGSFAGGVRFQDIDAAFIREISRYFPTMSEELASKFESAGIEAVENFDQRLEEKILEYYLHPPSVRDPNFLNYTERIQSLIKQWRSDAAARWDQASGHHSLHKFEDEIIREIGFKDREELYEFLRRKDPKDAGVGYLNNLREMKAKGRELKYADGLDKMSKLLEIFRTEPLPESDHILPQISSPGGPLPSTPSQNTRPQQAPPKSDSGAKSAKDQSPKTYDRTQPRGDDINFDEMIGNVCIKMNGKWSPGATEKVGQAVDRMRAQRAQRISDCVGPYSGICIKSAKVELTTNCYFESLLLWQCALFTSRSNKITARDRKLAWQEACTIQRNYLEPLQQEANGYGATMQKAPHQELLARLQLENFCDEPNQDGKPTLTDTNINPQRSDDGDKTPDAVSATTTKTGTTTTSEINPDGTRTVTTTDKDGNILSREKVSSGPTQASSTDLQTGVTTTSARNKDGTRTVTVTDKNGNVLSKETVGDGRTQASSTDIKTGITITSVRNQDGTRTMTVTDKDGNVISQEAIDQGLARASSTHTETGTTTTSVRNTDGSHTVTITDKDGNVLLRKKIVK